MMTEKYIKDRTFRFNAYKRGRDKTCVYNHSLKRVRTNTATYIENLMVLQDCRKIRLD
jgi:hypothetical protein